jgi:hypothetical protein
VKLTEVDSNGSRAGASARITVWGAAAELVRRGRTGLAHIRGALVLQTGRAVRCTAPAPCAVHVAVGRVAATSLIVRPGRTVALDPELNAAGRHLLDERTRVTWSVTVNAGATRAFPLRARFSLRL